MKRKILAAFVFVLSAIFCITGSASADLLYTRLDNSYSNTELGIIQGNDDPVCPLVSNMGGNAGQRIYQFANSEGKQRLAVSLYTMGSNDVINIYDLDSPDSLIDTSAWKEPVSEATSSLQNVHSLASSGSYLYGIAYDNSYISRITTENDSYTEDKTYQYVDENGADIHGEAVVAHGGNVYAIFSSATGDVWSDGQYNHNKLIKFDADLNVLDTVEMKGKNLNGGTEGGYVLSDGKLYVATLGGVQKYDGAEWNPESSIEIVDLESMTVSQPVTAQAMNEKDPTFKHMFSAVAVDGDTVYVQAVRWQSEETDDEYSIRIYKTTKEALKSGDLGELVEDFGDHDGYKTGMLYDEDADALWCGIGYDLQRYDVTKGEWKQYGSQALGGNLSAFAVLAKDTTPAGPDTPSGSGGSGGGCNGGFAALSLIALAPLALLRRRTR